MCIIDFIQARIEEKKTDEVTTDTYQLRGDRDLKLNGKCGNTSGLIQDIFYAQHWPSLLKNRVWYEIETGTKEDV